MCVIKHGATNARVAVELRLPHINWGERRVSLFDNFNLSLVFMALDVHLISDWAVGKEKSAPHR
jgi:hypothetical protein